MGLFLLLAALYIAPWMLGFSGWYSRQPYRDILFYVPFQHLFLLGPFVFFYVSSLFDPKFKVKGRLWLHLLPAALYLLFCVVMVVYDKLIVHRYYFLKSEEDPDFDNWYQITGLISLVVYFIACIRYYYGYKRAIEAIISNAADFLFDWVRNFLIAFLIILVAWLVMAVMGLFYNVQFSISWWYFLGFALCCYYIAIAGYSNSVETKLFFKSSFMNAGQEGYLLRQHTPARLGFQPEVFDEIHLADDSSSTEPEASQGYPEWKEKISRLIETEQLYEQAELTLFDVARRLNTNVSFLSKVINRSFQSNFNDLINGYRIKRFIYFLQQGEHKQQTLIALAYDCGFNSKTTFNRAFRKFSGISPQQYIRQHQL